MDFEPCGSASCDHGKLGDLLIGCLQLEKDYAMHHYQQSNGYQHFDKGHLRDVKIHKSCAGFYLCASEMYSVDLPEGNTRSDLGAFEHQ